VVPLVLSRTGSSRAGDSVPAQGFFRTVFPDLCRAACKLAVVKGVVQLVSTFLKRFLHNMVALNSQGRLTERTKIESHYYCPSNHYYLGGGTLSRSYYLL